MSRKVIAYHDGRVVCDDGSYWIHVSNFVNKKWVCFWKELTPIPGSQRDLDNSNFPETQKPYDSNFDIKPGWI